MRQTPFQAPGMVLNRTEAFGRWHASGSLGCSLAWDGTTCLESRDKPNERAHGRASRWELGLLVLKQDKNPERGRGLPPPFT